MLGDYSTDIPSTTRLMVLTKSSSSYLQWIVKLAVLGAITQSLTVS